MCFELNIVKCFAFFLAEHFAQLQFSYLYATTWGVDTDLFYGYSNMTQYGSVVCAAKCSITVLLNEKETPFSPFQTPVSNLMNYPFMTQKDSGLICILEADLMPQLSRASKILLSLQAVLTVQTYPKIFIIFHYAGSFMTWSSEFSTVHTYCQECIIFTL